MHYFFGLNGGDQPFVAAFIQVATVNDHRLKINICPVHFR